MAPVFAFALALACASWVGFAAHRASLCNVRAVAEILSSGSAHMLGSLMQGVLWATLLAGGASALLGRPAPAVPMPAAILSSLAGGWLFGVGAALNGGCSLSTLHRLADGELGMLATLIGFVAGVAVWAAMPAFGPVFVPVRPAWERWPAATPWLLGLLGIWAVRRIAFLRHVARRSARAGWLKQVAAPRYHFAAAAALMGLAAGVLYLVQGAWSYTNFLRSTVAFATADTPAPSGAHGLLVVALIGGMAVSALQRGSFAWRRPARHRDWLRHAGGGVAMGMGAALVPGGNDTLLLSALPTLTAQAVVAYLAMLFGIAMVWWLMQLARAPMPPVVCTAAGCVDRADATRTGHTRGEPG